MTEFRLAVGEIVQLKSGGPKLVIREVGVEDVTVDWFDKATARSRAYKPEQLQAYEDEFKPAVIIMDSEPLPKSGGLNR